MLYCMQTFIFVFVLTKCEFIKNQIGRRKFLGNDMQDVLFLINNRQRKASNI